MPRLLADLWLPPGDDGASIVTRAAIFVVFLFLSFLLAVAFRGAVRGAIAHMDHTTRRLLGRPDIPAPWATGAWACGRCRTVNRPARTACERCRAPRAQADMAFKPIATEPDILPATIPAGAGATVTLEHNAAAHTEGLNGHWRLRVNSVIVGSAARRGGALALLRAVEGAEAVLFDPKGEGYAAYSLPSLIAAFEGPRLPIRTPCPEAGR